jgi:predicted transcriptional regulator
MPIARFGGGCPRWTIHRAVRQPGETVAALVETPDGTRYLSFARAVRRVGAGGLATIVLGCGAEQVSRVALADTLPPLSVPIGPACRLCERPDCPERSLPPVTRGLELNPYQRPSAPYPFRAT